MTEAAQRRGPKVAVVGGGLAGLAAAAALAEQGFQAELFETRRYLGGRASSFRDPQSDELVDHCQHVSMGCCTNLADFCRRTGLDQGFRTDRVLHIFAPDGRRHDLQAAPFLPAPLHLLPSLLRLGYLSWSERFGIIRAMGKLARSSEQETAGLTIGQWLRHHGQTERAIELFWSVVLVSALSETVDNSSVAAARKVFVDGFLASRSAYEVQVPTVPLGELYGERLSGWLSDHGVELHLATTVEQIAGDAQRVTGLLLSGARQRDFEYFILAVPWRVLSDLIPAEMQNSIPALAETKQFKAAPITGVHLWFDRPLTTLPHAVIVGRLSQWLFNRGQRSADGGADQNAHYYQVVISASRMLAGREREQVVAEVVGELKQLFPEAKDAGLFRWRMVTDQAAVFSPRPEIEKLRPPQRTPIPNLMLAGDWTATGWPATMEGAVRSGYLAAEEVLEAEGRPVKLTVNDLPRGFCSRMFIDR